MKYLCMVGVLVLAIAIAAKSGSNERVLSDIMLENIEALSQTEDKQYSCYGSGKVECFDGIRVEAQYEFWSWGDEEETE